MHLIDQWGACFNRSSDISSQDPENRTYLIFLRAGVSQVRQLLWTSHESVKQIEHM